MLIFSVADFEDFRESWSELPAAMDNQLEAVVRKLVENRWPWRIHAPYNESIDSGLDLFKRVNQDMPFDGLYWFFDHAEKISPKNIERVDPATLAAMQAAMRDRTSTLTKSCFPRYCGR
jgi:hypothetical protein